MSPWVLFNAFNEFKATESALFFSQVLSTFFNIFSKVFLPTFAEHFSLSVHLSSRNSKEKRNIFQNGNENWNIRIQRRYQYDIYQFKHPKYSLCFDYLGFILIYKCFLRFLNTFWDLLYLFQLILFIYYNNCFKFFFLM